MADAFQVEGRVIEGLPNGTWRAELANGHRLTAFVTGRAKKNFAGLKAGDRVVTQGGIHGVVANLKGNIVQVKIADNVKVDVTRSAISQVLVEPTPASPAIS